MLGSFDELVQKRKSLKAWWDLGSTTANYDNKKHTLWVDIQKPAMVSYCGQEYAGAKNYHDAPDFFRDSVRDEIQRKVYAITAEAYAKEMENLTSQIEKHLAAVLEQLYYE